MSKSPARPSAQQPRPHVYQWISGLQSLGLGDRTVTADYPTALTFNRKTERTHVARNTIDRPTTVRFSHGTRLRVEAGKFAAKA